ncbi:MAG: hypothetical protein KAQ74_04100, partial [Dehalococcoidia bacterium]|nr:hypothetical protein [Dehalococcoidia bacterium]
MAKRRLLSFFLCLLFLSSSVGSIVSSPAVVRADYEALLWSTIRTPSDDDFVVVPPSEVSVLALGSTTVWYAADIANEKLYSTVDGGLTWQDD